MPHKTRRLWLKVKFDAPNVPRWKVAQHLLHSIARGNYSYPKSWRVAIGWSNHEHGELKWGEFTAEMKASAKSSPGFDIAVTQYLENQL